MKFVLAIIVMIIGSAIQATITEKISFHIALLNFPFLLLAIAKLADILKIKY